MQIFNKDFKTEIATSEIKHALEGIRVRHNTEERINELEDRVMKFCNRTGVF